MALHLAHTIVVVAQWDLAPLDLLARTFDVLTESFDDYLDFGVVAAVPAPESRDAFVLWQLLVDLGHFVVACSSCATVALNTFAAYLEVVPELRGAVLLVPSDFVVVVRDVAEVARAFVVVAAAAAAKHPNDVLAEVVQLNVYCNHFDLVVRAHN